MGTQVYVLNIRQDISDMKRERRMHNLGAYCYLTFLPLTVISFSGNLLMQTGRRPARAVQGRAKLRSVSMQQKKLSRGRPTSRIQYQSSCS